MWHLHTKSSGPSVLNIFISLDSLYVCLPAIKPLYLPPFSQSTSSSVFSHIHHSFSLTFFSNLLCHMDLSLSFNFMFKSSCEILHWLIPRMFHILLICFTFKSPPILCTMRQWTSNNVLSVCEIFSWNMQTPLCFSPTYPNMWQNSTSNYGTITIIFFPIHCSLASSCSTLDNLGYCKCNQIQQACLVGRFVHCGFAYLQKNYCDQSCTS